MAPLFAFVTLIVACGSPTWRYDHYVVDGALQGTTCRATIDGRPFAGDTTGLGEKMTIRRDNISMVGLRAGEGMKSIVCRGLVLGFVSAQGGFPGPRRFRVADGTSIDTGVVSVSVENSGVSEGHWPLALTGIHLEGKEGFLQLDEMTDSSARGTFHLVMRREANGE